MINVGIPIMPNYRETMENLDSYLVALEQFIQDQLSAGKFNRPQDSSEEANWKLFSAHFRGVLDFLKQHVTGEAVDLSAEALESLREFMAQFNYNDPAVNVQQGVVFTARFSNLTPEENRQLQTLIQNGILIVGTIQQLVNPTVQSTAAAIPVMFQQPDRGLPLRRAAANGDVNAIMRLVSAYRSKDDPELKACVEASGAGSGKNALHRALEPLVALCRTDSQAAIDAVYGHGSALNRLTDLQTRVTQYFMIVQILLDCRPALTTADKDGITPAQLLAQLPPSLQEPLSHAREINDLCEQIVRAHPATPSRTN